jgi:ssDNA-binding Zn-finger/Zn-ribbon topoisomerase 1
MIIRKGRRGPFLGCSGYPKCKNTGEVPAKLLEEMGINGNGESKNGDGKTDPIPLPEPIDHEDAA